MTAPLGGRDRRAVRHLAPDGAPDAALLPGRPHAIVVGAGIAGLAAAAGLAERGVRVTVAERAAGRSLRPGRSLEPAIRSLKPASRSPEPASRSPEPASPARQACR